jgi:hypothetical protein
MSKISRYLVAGIASLLGAATILYLCRGEHGKEIPSMNSRERIYIQ